MCCQLLYVIVNSYKLALATVDAVHAAVAVRQSETAVIH
jgi:hypothetical protein